MLSTTLKCSRDETELVKRLALLYPLSATAIRQ